MSPTRKAAMTCDICKQAILADEAHVNNDDETAHIACIRDWFRRNFGAEGLA